MRLKSAIWVSAYLRLCQVEGAFAAVRHRGAEDAGAIFIKISRLDGTSDLYGPAPQTAYDDDHPIDRAFVCSLDRQPDEKVEERMTRELRFDPDAWIVEAEDRAGRHFLGRVVA